MPTAVPLDLMKELEEELQNPTGITTVARPELRMNAVLVSKECGILLEMRDAVGLIAQRFWRKVTTCTLLILRRKKRRVFANADAGKKHTQIITITISGCFICVFFL